MDLGLRRPPQRRRGRGRGPRLELCQMVTKFQHSECHESSSQQSEFINLKENAKRSAAERGLEARCGVPQRRRERRHARRAEVAAAGIEPRQRAPRQRRRERLAD